MRKSLFIYFGISLLFLSGCSNTANISTIKKYTLAIEKSDKLSTTGLFEPLPEYVQIWNQEKDLFTLEIFYSNKSLKKLKFNYANDYPMTEIYFFKERPVKIIEKWYEASYAVHGISRKTGQYGAVTFPERYISDTLYATKKNLSIFNSRFKKYELFIPLANKQISIQEKRNREVHNMQQITKKIK